MNILKNNINGLKTAAMIIIAVLVFSSGYAQQKIQAEALVPGSASLYVKSSPVKKFIKSLKFVADNLLDEEQKGDFYKGIKEFNEKAGIDLLNPASLQGAGIDVDRPFSVAYANKDVQDQDRIIVFIPILNDKTFPAGFVEIIKKNSGDQHQDTFPAVTEYEGKSIYQVQTDVFGTALDGWFVVSSTAETIHEVIKLKSGSGESLALDPLYAHYVRLAKNNLDLNAFMKREFLDMLAGSLAPSKTPIERKGGMDEPQGEDQSFNFKRIFNETASSRPELINAQYNEGGQANESAFMMVDYISMSAGLKGNNVIVNAGSKFNYTNPMVGMILDLFQPGTASKSIFIDRSKAFTFISFNFNHLEKLCEQEMPGCAEYTAFKTQLNGALGIDISADFLPYYTGAVNLIVTDRPQGDSLGKFLVYLPMKNKKKTSDLIGKMTDKIVAELGPQNLAGRTSIGGMRGFWLLYQNKKLFCLSDARGIYIATSADIITKALKSELLTAQKRNPLTGRMGAKVFFLTYITREAYAMPMKMMEGQSPTGASVEKITNRMGDIYISGERSGSSLSLDFEIQILKPGK